MAARTFTPQQTDAIRTLNRLEIITIFRDHGALSRAEIRKHTSLSPASITNITSQLLDEDVLRISEKGVDKSLSLGRPRTLLELHPKAGHFLSIFLSFNGIWLEVLDYQGRSQGKVQANLAVGSLTAGALALEIQNLAQQLCETCPHPLKKVVVATQGVTDGANSALLWSPILSLDGLSFVSVLATIFSVPVLVFNDSNMIAQAIRHSRRKNDETFGVLLLSYGIGLSLLLKGEVFAGAQSSGSEIGHMPYRPNGSLCRCGKRGCVEAYASDYAILRSARGLTDEEGVSTRVSDQEIGNLLDEAEKADGPARQALNEAATCLGITLATLFSLFDEFPLVFVGPTARLIPFMEPQMTKVLAENHKTSRPANFEFTLELDDLTLVMQGLRHSGLRDLDEQISAQRQA